MKSATVVVSALAMALLASACGSSGTTKGSGTGTTGATPSTAGTGSGNAAPPSPAALAGKPILIGWLGGSGGIAEQNVDAGTQAAVDYVNSTGGIHGRPLKLDLCDNAGTPEATTQCGNKFVSDHVSIVGRFALNESALLAPLEAAGIPFYAESPNSQAAYTSKDVIGLTSGVLEGLTLPAAYGSTHGLKSNATLLVNTPQSGAVAAASKLFFTKAGVSFTDQLVSAGTPDLTSAVTSATASKPSSLSIIGPLSFCLSGLQAAKAIGYTGQIFIAGCSDPMLPAKAGSSLDGVITAATAEYVALGSDQQTFVAAMRKFAPSITPADKPVAELFGDIGLIAAVMNKVMPATSDFSGPSTLAAFKSLKDFSYPFDDGIPITCDGTAVPSEPSVCSAKTHIGQFKNGAEVDAGVLDFSGILK